jgi:hypothetical protein
MGITLSKKNHKVLNISQKLLLIVLQRETRRLGYTITLDNSTGIFTVMDRNEILQVMGKLSVVSEWLSRENIAFTR